MLVSQGLIAIQICSFIVVDASLFLGAAKHDPASQQLSANITLPTISPLVTPPGQVADYSVYTAWSGLPTISSLPTPPGQADGSVFLRSVGLANETKQVDGYSAYTAWSGLPTISFLPTPPRQVDTYSSFLYSFGLESERAQSDKVSPAVRRALFEARHAEVLAHNAKAGKRWEATINHFADLNVLELGSRLGHKPGREHHSRASTPSSHMRGGHSGPFSSLRMGASERTLAAETDWRAHLLSSHYVRDQGSCGSCWAVAAASTLELHGELASGNSQNITMISSQQLVNCVPNPQKCGGSGGCGGATAELAYEFVKRNGVVLAQDANAGSCEPPSGPHYVVDGFVHLPMNQGMPLMRAIATVGPAAVSADARDWFPYKSGVFDYCSPDAEINHAITMMGYGHDVVTKTDYWLIRNSWGKNWGEQGFMRLVRHAEDGDYCGTDYAPEVGIGCEGGPKQMRVCGMCGILTDSAYPVGVRFVQEPFSGVPVQTSRRLRSVSTASAPSA